MRKSELIDIYILEILERHAHKDHKLTQNQIIELLNEEYGVECTRNTLSKYLSALREDGRIAGERGVYKVNKFSDEELRLLIDGVLFGQHIPVDDAKEIIKKLKSLSELGLKERVKNVYYVEGFNRTQNKRLQVVVNPYQLVTEKSHYYLICFVDDSEGKGYHGNDLENLRIDRWWSVEETNIRRKKIESIPGYEHGLKLDKYMREHIYMWTGTSERVTLRIQNYNVRDFVDWFGTDYRLIKIDEEYTEVSIKANVNAIKFWALQYGGVATVLKPESLRKELLNTIEEMQNRYMN